MIQKYLFFNIHDNKSVFIKSKLKLIKYQIKIYYKHLIFPREIRKLPALTLVRGVTIFYMISSNNY